LEKKNGEKMRKGKNCISHKSNSSAMKDKTLLQKCFPRVSERRERCLFLKDMEGDSSKLK